MKVLPTWCRETLPSNSTRPVLRLPFSTWRTFTLLAFSPAKLTSGNYNTVLWSTHYRGIIFCNILDQRTTLASHIFGENWTLVYLSKQWRLTTSNYKKWKLSMKSFSHRRAKSAQLLKRDCYENMAQGNVLGRSIKTECWAWLCQKCVAWYCIANKWFIIITVKLLSIYIISKLENIDIHIYYLYKSLTSEPDRTDIFLSLLHCQVP